jgi:flagellar hook assembly protein FlgD
VAVAVYSADGRLVRMLEREDVVGSGASFEWNGRDSQGKEVPAGVYIAVAEGQSLRDGVRMVKMR